MWKKLMLACFSLLFMFVANLDICCQVSVCGTRLSGLYSPFALDRSETAAVAAAQEILEGPAPSPHLERTYCLSLRPAEGDGRYVTDAALRSITGVRLNQGVFINGKYLGCVEDGTVLFETLRSFILNQMPNAAVFGNISGQVQVRSIYGRTGQNVDYDDMVLLISGMAPVIYTDQSGKLV